MIPTSSSSCICLAVLAVLALPKSSVRAEAVPLKALKGDELRAKLDQDSRAVQIYRKGLQSVLEFVASQAELFPPEKLSAPRLLDAERKKVVYSTWKMSLDYLLALDSVKKYHQGFYKLKGEAKKDSLAVGYAAFLAQYSFALRFIERVENDPGLDTVLNEPLPDLGLAKGTYAQVKFEYLNVARAGEFAALAALHKSLGEGGIRRLQAGIATDSAAIWKAGKGKGELLTLKNALRIAKKTGLRASFPVQAGISEWMGDTKVHRKGRSLISQEQIRAFVHRLEPGDILIERREWYLSNMGLPGFWTHAALYVGTPGERAWYGYDKQLEAWVRKQGEASGDFERLLRKRQPEQYALSLQPLEDGRLPRVIEAMSEGVQLTTLEHSAAADSFAVLRPRLSVKDKAAAILRAFGFVGRPYDFDFDFLTDSSMVCTEVIFKAYQPTKGYVGLRLPVESVIGHTIMPANALGRLFDEEFGRARQQLDFILFLDGDERAGKAVRRRLERFRESWKRPKWHIVKR